MIRVYCDSNIYRYLKPDHPSFSKELLDVFETLKDKMLFTFSDAHLDDLKDAEANHTEGDLLLMGRYVKDNYFMHDFIKDKATSPYLATPLEAFRNKDYAAYNKTLENPFDLDSILGNMDDFPEGKLLKDMMKSMFSVPIGALTGNYITPDIGAEGKEFINKMIPGYNPLMSLKDFMNSMWPYVNRQQKVD